MPSTNAPLKACQPLLDSSKEEHEMKVLQQLARERGITHCSLQDISMPIELAFEDDQFTPLLVAATAITHARSQFNPGVDLPWTISDDGGDECLIDGLRVIPQISPIPGSVALLFLDYQLEHMILKQMQELGLTEAPECLSFDSLAFELQQDHGLDTSFDNDPLAKSVMSYV